MNLLFPHLEDYEIPNLIPLKLKDKTVSLESYLLRDIFRFLDIYNISGSCFGVNKVFLIMSIQRLRKDQFLDHPNRKKTLNDLNHFLSFNFRVVDEKEKKKSEGCELGFPSPLVWNLCFAPNEVTNEQKTQLSFFALQSFYKIVSSERTAIEEDGDDDDKRLEHITVRHFLYSLKTFQKEKKYPLQPWNIPPETLRLFLDEKEEKVVKMLLYWCCFTGQNLEIVENIIQGKNGSKIFNDEKACNDLILLSMFGRSVELVKNLVKYSSGRIERHMNYNLPIKVACEVGDLPMVRYLLESEKVNPVVGKKSALLFTCYKPEEEETKKEDLSEDFEKLEIARLLLKDRRIDPSEALPVACLHGRFEIVKLLLEDGRTDPSHSKNKSLRNAACCASYKIVELLLQDPRVLNGESIDDAFQSACNDEKEGSVKTVKAFLCCEALERVLEEKKKAENFEEESDEDRGSDYPFLPRRLRKKKKRKKDPMGVKDGLERAIKRKYTKVVQAILEDKRIQEHPKKEKFYIKYGCYTGNVEMVQKSLEEMSKKGTKVSYKFGKDCVQNASKSGHYSVVKFLLEDKEKRFTPTYFSISNSAPDLQILKILLEDERINPTEEAGDGPIKYYMRFSRSDAVRVLNDVVKEGNLEIIKYFLSMQHSRFKPFKEKHYVKFVRKAMVEGHEFIVDFLFQYAEMDQKTQNEIRFESYCKLGLVNLAKNMVHKEKVDPSSHENYAIRKASSKGNVELVKFLVGFEEVNPGDKDNKAIVNACFRCNVETVKILLEHPKVDPTSNDHECFRDVCRYTSSIEIAKLLLDDRRVDPLFKGYRDRDGIFFLCREPENFFSPKESYLFEEVFKSFEILRMIVSDKKAGGRIDTTQYDEEVGKIVRMARKHMFLNEKGEPLELVRMQKEDLEERVQFVFFQMEDYWFGEKCLSVKFDGFVFLENIPSLFLLLI